MIQYNKIQQEGVKIMFFFDKRKAAKHMKTLFKTELTLGVPKKVGGRTGKFKIMGKPFYTSSNSSVSYSVHDEYSFVFKCEYNKDKTFRLTITALRLDLSYSQNGMKMIREQYSAYTFFFNQPYTEIRFPVRKVSNMQDFKEKLSADIRYWNNSGLYNLLLQLYKV